MKYVPNYKSLDGKVRVREVTGGKVGRWVGKSIGSTWGEWWWRGGWNGEGVGHER